MVQKSAVGLQAILCIIYSQWLPGPSLPISGSGAFAITVEVSQDWGTGSSM